MPIYEYYSPDTNKIYSFFAKTLAQGQSIPKCPDNPKHRMVKVMSSFAITGGGKKSGEEASVKDDGANPGDTASPAEDARMGALDGESGGGGYGGPPSRDPNLYDYQ